MDLKEVLGISVLVIMFVGAAVLVAVARVRQARFEKGCRDRGWQVERETGQGYRLTVRGSTGGVDWEYEHFSYRSRNRDMSSSRVQVNTASLPGELVVVTPRTARTNQIGGMIQGMKQLGAFGRTMVELVVVEGLHGNPSDVDLFMALQPAQAGSDALRQEFTVVATNESAADQFLRRGEAALLEFASDPSVRGRNRHVTVLLWSKGLTLPLDQPVDDVNTLERLAALASEMARSFKSSG